MSNRERLKKTTGMTDDEIDAVDMEEFADLRSELNVALAEQGYARLRVEERDALIADLRAQLASEREAHAETERQLGQFEVQLAGCGVAAAGWSQRDPVTKGQWAWSQAYQDVLDLRLKYEDLQRRLADATNEAVRLVDQRTRDIAYALCAGCAADVPFVAGCHDYGGENGVLSCYADELRVRFPSAFQPAAAPVCKEPHCPVCGGALQEVRYPEGSMLNREQFDSVRAGDYFCKACKGTEAKSGYKYWWKRDLETAAPVVERAKAEEDA